jgi:baseplate J-like protein
MPTPNEREFAVFRRGEVREDILRFFRNGLRNLPDPETGELFTEDVIRKSTTAGGRWYVEADAIDLACQGIQKRDEFLAQQMRVDRAGTSFLQNFHAPQWGERYLPATGGSGSVTATGLPGTTWIGSTQVPDPFATFGTDEAGKRFQVLVSGAADGAGVATLLVIGIDGGLETNLDVGSEIRWSNAPPSSNPSATVVGAKFTGGGPAETDAAFSLRLAARIRHKPGAGNDAQMRALARAASNAVEDAFVYPCAMNAGSVLVAITQKRGIATGPDARVASAGVLLLVTAAIVPPGSPDIPGQGFVVVLPDTPEPANAVVQLALRKGSGAGWADLQPFPPVDTGGAAVAVSLVTTQTDFRITLAAGAGLLPNGASSVSAVALMVWDVPSSRFIALSVNVVTDLGAGVYRVQLLSPSTHTIAIGDWISPATLQRDSIAEAAEAYFDSLGPGEVVDLSTSTLAARAFRRPVPSEEYPARAGQSLISFVAEGLGAVASDATLASISVQSPTVPTDPIDGPARVTLGKFAAYELP